MPKTETPTAASIMIEELKSTLTTTETREWEALEMETLRTWRRFWIKAADRAGHSNRYIARVFEISEGTVRAVLRGER